MPLGLLLVLDREQHDRSVSRVGEASLAHGGERHVCHLLDNIVQVAAGSMGISTQTSQQVRSWAWNGLQR
jgi:hypothetical protein